MEAQENGYSLEFPKAMSLFYLSPPPPASLQGDAILGMCLDMLYHIGIPVYRIDTVHKIPEPYPSALRDLGLVCREVAIQKYISRKKWKQ